MKTANLILSGEQMIKLLMGFCIQFVLWTAALSLKFILIVFWWIAFIRTIMKDIIQEIKIRILNNEKR